MLPAEVGPLSTIRRGGQRLVRWKNPWLPVDRRNRPGLASELRALRVHDTGEHRSANARGQNVLDARRGDRARVLCSDLLCPRTKCYRQFSMHFIN